MQETRAGLLKLLRALSLTVQGHRSEENLGVIQEFLDDSAEELAVDTEAELGDTSAN